MKKYNFEVIKAKNGYYVNFDNGNQKWFYNRKALGEYLYALCGGIRRSSVRNN